MSEPTLQTAVEPWARAVEGASPIGADPRTLPSYQALREEIAGTLRAVTKLGGAVELVSPGALPNDGKVIADER